MKDYFVEFKNYLTTEKNSSKNTLESYLRDLSQFLSYLDTVGINNINNVNNKEFLNYIEHLQKAGKSSSTLSRTVASLKNYFSFLVNKGCIAETPVFGVNIKKEEKKLPDILTNKEVELLLSQPDCTDLKGCRDKAMLEVLYATGIRVSELINLTLNDVNIQVGILHLNSKKSERIIPMYPEAIKSLLNYCTKVRDVVVLDPEQDVLFTNMNGNKLTRQGFWKIIKQYAKQAGIEKDITPHTLRHSFAAHLLQNGAPLKEIQEILGHSDISSTQVYAHMLRDKYSHTYKKYHPMA